MLIIFRRQQFDVILPIYTFCNNCVIRLLHHPSKWGSDIFWSCADIIIIPHPNPSSCESTENGKTKREARRTIETAQDAPNSELSTDPSTPRSFPCPFTSCYEGKCLNGGKCNITTGNCSCKRLFGGDRCQQQGGKSTKTYLSFVYMLKLCQSTIKDSTAASDHEKNMTTSAVPSMVRNLEKMRNFGQNFPIFL